MKPGTALVLSAPSGAGKSTLVKRLLEACPGFGYSISYTTRAPRAGEKDGVDYHFVTKEEFLQHRDAGDLAEWAEVHGNYYGTPLTPLRDMLAAGQNILFDIDVQGAAQLRLSVPQALLVFILPPSLAELERRLRGRGTDAEDVILRRLANARGEIREARWFDAVIVNDDLERASRELIAAFTAASLRPSCAAAAIDALLA